MSKVEHHRTIAGLFDAFVEKAASVVVEGDDEPRRAFQQTLGAVREAIGQYRAALESAQGKGRLVADSQGKVVSVLHALMVNAHAAGANGELPHEFKPYMVGQLGNLVSIQHRRDMPPSGDADLAEKFRNRAHQRGRR